MISLNENRCEALLALFPTYTYNYIAEAVLERTTGEVFVDDADTPQVVALTAIGGRLHILGGDADHPAAAEYLQSLRGLSMIIPGAPGWDKRLQSVLEGKLITLPRYAFDSASLTPEHLKALQERLSDQYRLEPITPEIAQSLFANRETWAEDQFFGFADAEDFIARGFGYCAFAEEQIVCIAAAGAASSHGIEIQIDTNPKFRKQGLATATGAALIAASLEKGIDPNWDAATEISAALAKKLGYTPAGEYKIYYYMGSRFLVRLRNFLRRIRGKSID